AHLAEEERQQERADVRSVNVSVRHQNDLVIAQLRDVEVVDADAGAESGDQRANFFVAEHLVVARFFYVEDFALERQNRLVFAIAALLGGAAGRLALDDEQFGPFGVTLLTVGEFAGQSAGIEGTFAAGKIAGLAGRLTGAGSVD